MPRIITTACTLLVLSTSNAPIHAQASEVQASEARASKAQADARIAVSNASCGSDGSDLARFGAAAWLPADYSYFSSTQDLGLLIEDIIDSRTWQSLAQLPMVGFGLSQLEQSLSRSPRCANRLRCSTTCLRSGAKP